MAGLLDLIDLSSGVARIGDGIEVAEVLEELESGGEATTLADQYELHPSALIAAVAFAGWGGEEMGGPALVQEPTRRPKLVEALEPALRKLFPSTSRPKLLALAAGLYQALDAWEESHGAAQEADDLGERGTSAYWHGIAHRREPDAWNAGYWFRRVGSHQIYPALAEGALYLCGMKAERAMAGKIAPAGKWDPIAFIEVCTHVAVGGPGEEIARSIQRLEMSLLLDESLRGI